MFKKRPVHLLTIPKGTLLFRTAENYDTDFTGIPLNGKSCIPTQYNVFFYFNPFVVDSIHWYNFLKDMRVYETTQDVKVIMLLKPSKITRGDYRGTAKKPVIMSCAKTRKACVPGREYDPCFSETFLKKHPNVLGYIGLARSDSDQLREGMQGSLKNLVKYIQLAEDNRGFKGSPEIVLHPLRKRVFDNIIISDKSEFVKQQSFVFKHITTLPREHDTLVNFLQTKTQQDPNTGFFTYNEKSK